MTCRKDKINFPLQIIIIYSGCGKHAWYLNVIKLHCNNKSTSHKFKQAIQSSQDCSEILIVYHTELILVGLYEPIIPTQSSEYFYIIFVMFDYTVHVSIYPQTLTRISRVCRLIYMCLLIRSNYLTKTNRKSITSHCHGLSEYWSFLSSFSHPTILLINPR